MILTSLGERHQLENRSVVELFRGLGIEFEVTDLLQDSSHRSRVPTQQGEALLPFVYINGVPIGGLSDLQLWVDDERKLLKIVGRGKLSPIYMTHIHVDYERRCWTCGAKGAFQVGWAQKK